MWDAHTIWKAWVIALAGMMVLMIYQCLILCAVWVPVDYEPTTVINISVSMLGMVIALFIYVGCAYDRWLRGGAQNALLLLSFYECLTLNCTLVFCYVDGNPDMGLINDIANIGYFSASLVMPFLFSLYIFNQRSDTGRGVAFHIIVISTICGLLILIANAFGCFLFYIDEAGFYQRTDLIWVSFICPAISIITAMVWGYIRLNTILERFTLAMFCLLIFVPGAVQLFFSDVQIMYIGVLLSLFTIYCNVYIKRGYALAEKEVELNNEKHMAMVSQIRPHFLYNVLNTIMGMDDVNQMRRSIGMFGKYLRGNLDILSLDRTIPFAKELDHVKTYVDLEKIRYEDRLTVKYEISAIGFSVPPLCVQVLVENAIKHGIGKREEGGIVVIRSYFDDDNYYVEVNDSGVGFDTSVPLSKERSHIGVYSARSRLKEMMGGTIDIESVIDEGTYAKITVPRKNESQGASPKGETA